MTRYKSNNPATDEYYNALGQATFIFSTLEWNVVCIARKIKVDFITREFYTKWTSGKVNKKFIEILKSNKELLGNIYDKLFTHAEEFGKIIDRRNAFVHSQPITGHDGSAMLAHYEFISSFHWKIEELDSFSKEAEELSQKFNHILHYEMPELKEQSV